VKKKLAKLLAFALGVGVVFVLVARWAWGPPPDLEVEARAFAEAFVKGDCEALWRYASPEERSRWDVAEVKRLYEELVVKRLGGVRLFTGTWRHLPRPIPIEQSVAPASEPAVEFSPGDYFRFSVFLQSGDGWVIRCNLRMGLRGRRVETSLSQFFFEVARGYVNAQIPWNEQKTSRTVVALEKFGEVFRSCGLSGLYEYWSKEWFSWEEWEAFARSGRMTGTGFD
jgi:hypothetical protein